MVRMENIYLFIYLSILGICFGLSSLKKFESYINYLDLDSEKLPWWKKPLFLWIVHCLKYVSGWKQQYHKNLTKNRKLLQEWNSLSG